ncbi:hypothetical protein DOY81_009246 [Sarcophaga bullata]|nr:hypothetical protein DOY81_009246 [Sarcophaga bullata]
MYIPMVGYVISEIDRFCSPTGILNLLILFAILLNDGKKWRLNHKSRQEFLLKPLQNQYNSKNQLQPEQNYNNEGNIAIESNSFNTTTTENV